MPKEFVSIFCLSLFTFIIIFLLPVFSASAAGPTFVSGTISIDTTWTAADSPFVVQGILTIDSGVALTIDPGVVVKFDSSSSRIVVNGNLYASGLTLQPVTFTSIKDDDAGGDTNNDGPSTGSAGDWGNITVHGAANISNAVIRYGGGFVTIFGSVAVFAEGGSLTIDHSRLTQNTGAGIISAFFASVTVADSEFGHSLTGIYQRGGSMNITDSFFHNNFQDGIRAVSGALSVTASNFQENPLPIFLSPDVDFTHSNNTAASNTLNGIGVDGTIFQSRTWTKDNIPYIIFSGPNPINPATSTVTIAAGGTLTINPGVVVKFFLPSSRLIVNGLLNVVGTAQEPIYFTSLKDDTVGGDTNNDLASTTPAPGNWGNITVQFGTANISNAVIRYGGGFFTILDPTAIYVEGTLAINHSHLTQNVGSNIASLSSSIVIANSEFDNAFVGIRQFGGTASIIGSDIHDNVTGFAQTVHLSIGSTTIRQSAIHDNSFGVSASGPLAVDAKENFWGSLTGPFHPTLNPGGFGNAVSDNVLFQPFLQIDPLKRFTPDNPRKVKVAVILAEFSDVMHESSSIIAQPCKLIPPKIYPNGHDKSYYEDLSFCVDGYHDENSFGVVDLDFEIFDNQGKWFNIGKNKILFPKSPIINVGENESKFVIEAISTSTANNVDLSIFDIVAVVHEGTSNQLSVNTADMETLTWPPSDQPLSSSPFKFIIAEDDPIGFWAHEIGHIVGELVIPPPNSTMIPDLKPMGLGIITEGRWDVMAEGSASNPPYMSSYTKEFLQWLNYDIHPLSGFGTHIIHSLDTADFGDSIFRYNREDNTLASTTKFYILEARNKTLRTWDQSLPEEKALVLYKVNSHGLQKYDYASDGMPINRGWSINIPFFDGVLTPNGDSHLDPADLIKFTAVSDTFVNGDYMVTVRIDDTPAAEFIRILRGVVLDPSSKLLLRALNLLPPVFKTQPRLAPFVEQTLYDEVFGCCEYRIGVGLYAVISLMIIIIFVWLFRISTLQNLKLLMLELFSFTASKLAISSLILLPLLFTNKYLLAFFPYHAAQFWVIRTSIHRPMGVSAGPIIYVFNVVTVVLISYMIACFLVFSSKNRLQREKIIKTVITLVTLIVSVLFLATLFKYIDENNNFFSKISKIDNSNSISSFNAPSDEPINLLDLDLHAITPDGRHVGMNYQTGEYEVQIPDAITIGDMSNDTEWIFLPDNIEATFYVSSRDNHVFLNQNPDIASQLQDTSDSYDIYARFIDPATGIFTSQTLENQVINPGETINHSISGTSTITIASGTPRIIPAIVRIEPETLNINKQGVFTVFIQIPEGFGATIKDIDPATISINGLFPIKIQLADNNRLIAKFQTQDFSNLPVGNSVKLFIRGKFFDGTTFEGFDTIRIINNTAKIKQLSFIFVGLLNILNQLIEVLNKL